MCKTCKRCFSETRDTVFFGLDTSQDEVLRTLAIVPEKGGIRGAARATGHDKNTISRWLDIAEPIAKRSLTISYRISTLQEHRLMRYGLT